MKSLKYILFFLLIIIVGFAIYVSVQPNNFEVSRTRNINAPASVIYNNVIDFNNWEAWSSWKEKDPTTTFSYSKKTIGVGAYFSWVDKEGEGTMKVVSTTPNTSIEHEMQFNNFEPSTVNFSLEPVDHGSTKTTWKINSEKLPFIFKAMAVFSGGFDHMIGPDFDRDLEKLDHIIVESTKKYNIEINGITEYGGGFYLYKTTSATGANINNIMAQQYKSITNYMVANKITQNGSPFTIYLENNLKNGNVIMSNAIPVKEKINITGESQVLCAYAKKTKVLKTTLTGNYTNLGSAWKEAYIFIEQNGLKVNPNIKPFEVYTNDPEQYANPADWITEIYIPIKE